MKIGARTGSGSRGFSTRLTVVVLLALLMILAGCSGMSNEAEEEMMELMNHTATGEHEAGMDMNDTALSDEPLAESEVVTFDNQTSGGKKVIVRSITVPDGGYAVLHNTSDVRNESASVIGVSKYLEPGTHEHVSIHLYQVPGKELNKKSAHIMGATRVHVVPHHETNGNQTFDYAATGSAQDTPYLDENGTTAIESAIVTLDPSFR